MAEEQELEVLLFDLGGVLVDFVGFERLNLLLDEPSDDTAIRKRWIESEALRRFESGQISPAEFAQLFVTEWQLSASPDDFLHLFSDWSRGLYPGADRLLQRLQRTHRLACLSNSNRVHGPSQRRWLDGFVDHFFFSYEMGLAKPDPAIFARTIRRLAVAPIRIAYFDDTTVNVKAATDAGMSAHLVMGVSELSTTLKRLGVLSD